MPAPRRSRSVNDVFRPLKPAQLIRDVVAGGAFGLIAIWVDLVVTGGAWRTVGVVITCILFGTALALRRLSPALALAVAWVAAIVQMALGGSPGFMDLAIFAVLYATAAYGSTLVFWLGFSSAIVGSAVITVYIVAPSLFRGGVDVSVVPQAGAVLLASLFGLMLSWTVGALLRTAIRARESRRAQEAAQVEAATEQGRVRIARDMHDVVAHSLAVVIAQADGARYAAATDASAATAALGTISATARAALADVRLLLTQLRHSQGAGPQPTLADLEALYAQVRAAGLALEVDIDPAPPGEPPAAVQLAVYRILQEALTNAIRHGDGVRPVSVRLAWWPDRVEVNVRNGVRRAGVPAGGLAGGVGVESHAGHGLIGMRERAQLAGGWLEADREGDAFAVRAVIPIGGVS